MVRQKIERSFIWRLMLWFQKAVLVVTGAGSALLVTYNVIARFFLKTDVFAIEELITVATVWMYFMGSSYASHEKNQIVADLISPMLKTKTAKKINAGIVGVLNVFVLGYFTYHTWDYIAWSWKIWPKTSGLHIPLMASQFPILLGIVFMLIYELFYFVLLFLPEPDDEAESKEVNS